MLGDKIKELRKKRGLSLRALACSINISISFLSDIENNRSKPSLDRLKDIAVGLETTVSYLLNESISDSPRALESSTSLDRMLEDNCQRLIYGFKNFQGSESEIQESKPIFQGKLLSTGALPAVPSESQEDLSEIQELLSELEEVLSELQDFSNWPDKDKEELLNYLRAKRIIRKENETG